jgi:prolyl-tRNA synthetase
MRIVADASLKSASGRVAGANRDGFHIKNVDLARDTKLADGDFADLVIAMAGDLCPNCGKPIVVKRGIEVGQVFKLGTKYSVSMGAEYTDENMEKHPMVMGCYGIGVTRTLAAVVEQHHDDNGIIWPVSVAPYHAMIVLINAKDEAQKALAEQLYEKLQAAGVEVCLDDRDERPGVKFKDADLLGFPIRITVGKKAAEGKVEYKLRRGGDMEELTAAEAAEKAIALVNAERRG